MVFDLLVAARQVLLSENLPDKMFSSNSFRESTSPQNCQLNTLISNSKE
jgi:hypothetical protein